MKGGGPVGEVGEAIVEVGIGVFMDDGVDTTVVAVKDGELVVGVAEGTDTVFVGIGVDVGDRVGVEVASGDAVGEGDIEGISVFDGVSDGLSVGVYVGCNVGVHVGATSSVGVNVGYGVLVGL